MMKKKKACMRLLWDVWTGPDEEWMDMNECGLTFSWYVVYVCPSLCGGVKGLSALFQTVFIRVYKCTSMLMDVTKKRGSFCIRERHASRLVRFVRGKIPPSKRLGPRQFQVEFSIVRLVQYTR